MPRPRTPTAILEARGAFIAHPERKTERANEPTPIGDLGRSPKYFTKEEKAIWKELSQIIPPRVAANCDRVLVEIACQLMAKLRARTILVGEQAQLLGCLSKLGMTPADRSRVHAAPQGKEENDPWAQFAQPNAQTQ